MTKKFDENMDEFFDLSPLDQSEIELIPQKTSGNLEHLESDFMEDYAKARDNFDELITKGKEALDDILAIAKESEQPRSFEVAATLLNNLVTANEKMIAIHKQVREITNYKSTEINNTNINNTLFVGSTTELSKLVKEIKEREILMSDE